MSLEITWPPTAPGERFLSYRICPLFMSSICYWEVCKHFSGGGGFSSRGLPRGEFFIGEGSFQGVNFSGEVLYWEVSQNSYMKFFLFLAFSLLTQFHAWRC